MLITAPGIYDMPEHIYHSDPCPAPSLSSSIAKKIARQSPMHAHFAHPRLGGGAGAAASSAMDDGTIIHRLLLGKGSDLAILDFDDFRTKAAKEQRDAAREAGKVPVLRHKLAVLHRCSVAARTQIERHPEARHLFGAGRPEQAMIWQEDGTWFRALTDWMLDDPRGPLIDLKTTGMSAAPLDWERRIITEYAFQDAFYARGFKALRGHEPPPMLFIVIEQEAPHGVSVMAAAPSLRAIAAAEVERAVTIWRHCMKTGEWPGYSPMVAHVEAPTWLLYKMEEQAQRDEIEAAAA